MSEASFGSEDRTAHSVRKGAAVGPGGPQPGSVGGTLAIWPSHILLSGSFLAMFGIWESSLFKIN